jgi:hypothetical protein
MKSTGRGRVKMHLWLNTNALWLIQQRKLHRNHRLHVFKDTDNPFDYERDESIVSKYWLPWRLIVQLCQLFERELKRPTLRSCTLLVSLQIIVALRFFATGSFDISRQCMSYVLSNVINCIIRITNTCTQNICLKGKGKSII